MPEVSVIVPVYNTSNYLSRCLDSILMQTFKGIEIICVNDGSTDGSLRILEHYQKSDCRLKIVSQTNQGLSAARNTGLKNAHGDFVIFVDSDDSISDNFIESLLSASKKFNSDVVMTTTKHHTAPSDKFKNDSRCGVYHNFIDKVRSLPHGGCWNKIYRKDFLDKYNLDFPCGLLFEDNPFTLKALYHCSSFAVINEGCYNYFSNPNSICTDPLKEQQRKNDSLIILKQIWDFFSQKLSFIEQQYVLKFCVNRFIYTKFLEDDAYYKELNDIIGYNIVFKKLRFKIIKRRIMKTVKNLFCKIFFIKYMYKV